MEVERDTCFSAPPITEFFCFSSSVVGGSESSRSGQSGVSSRDETSRDERKSAAGSNDLHKLSIMRSACNNRYSESFSLTS